MRQIAETIIWVAYQDRFDLRIEVPAVRFQDLSLPASDERSHVIAKRVLVRRPYNLQHTRQP